MTTIRQTYEPITGRAPYKVRCGKCGKPLRRTATVTQTASPFNRDASGQPRTPSVIRKAVAALADAEALRLSQSPATCRACGKAA